MPILEAGRTTIAVDNVEFDGPLQVMATITVVR
jgi:hypothetical protein